MPRGRRMWAYALAALGSAGVIVSMWLPWYSFRFPAAAIDQAERLGQQFGALGPLIRQGAEVIRNLGTVHFNARDVLHQADVAIALAAAAAGGLALLASSGRANGVRSIIVLAAAVALVVTLYRTVVPPGPGGYLHAAWGAYLALVCGLAALAGGLLAGDEDPQPSWTPPDVAVPDQAAAWQATSSVAPPGFGR